VIEATRIVPAVQFLHGARAVVVFALTVILALVLFPFVMFMAVTAWLRLGGAVAIGAVFGSVVGVAVSLLTLWKVRGVIRRILDVLGSRSPEPVYSCIVSGAAGALLIGSIMFTVILLLGHTRPMGWEVNRIPAAMAIAFLIAFLCGLPLGIQRRRDRNT